MNVSPIWSCPTSLNCAEDRILLDHGEGGALMRRLIADRILPRLGRRETVWDDATVLPPLQGRPVITTDAFVVSPHFFPGGDIGTLAVFGTVNDLAVRGAKPLWLTLSLILEEGLPLVTIERVLDSIATASSRCGVAVIAGDTKVVPRGDADGMYLTTTGLGQLIEPAPTGAATIIPGDQLIVSGPIGRHGIAVLAAREQLGFEPPPQSDCGPLLDAVIALRSAGIQPRAMRDATRGGVAAVLHEWARDCGHTLTADESQVPVSAEVRGVCELLGLDPLHVANEGTMLLAVPADQAPSALNAIRNVSGHAQAAIIGAARNSGAVPVVIRRALGREQPLIEVSGAPLPRIC